MAYEWRCADCGQAWPEEGRGSYVLTAGQHMKRQEHQPLGLIDTDTGEILVSGSINRNAAEKLGIIERPDRSRKKNKPAPPDAETMPLDAETPAPSSPRPMSQPQPLGGSDPAMSGEIKKTRQSVESLGPGDPKDQVVGFEVQWPLWALSFFNILRGDFRDENDQPYAWSTKDFVRFVLDVYRHACHTLVRKMAEDRMHQYTAAERTLMVQSMISTAEAMPASQFLEQMAQHVEANDPVWARMLRMQARTHQEGA
ncbi:hypothetical protein [Sulfobacillus harzensis]|uniref:Uncharacterized protein n=1 Tax=Sulfobacillus harzensis TaxID=2729629 RepID=A0A7Y0Q2T2_9FIRM|nr:hypothetical protein [Sulfobacillus harzensis]NMP22216.1 hypothetical protein [Sulfobacillus harzensis]